MVRISETATFSSSPYFLDRGSHGTAKPLTHRINPHSRPIVSYYSPKDVGLHHYGELHPMKPHRLALTNALVFGYGLDKQIHHVYDVRAATQTELEMYHTHDYIDFLSRVTPTNRDQMLNMIEEFNCGEDCPIFADLYHFVRMYAGGSLAGARKLCAKSTDIAINWSGGLHHAKRGEASGFCYINDIVLAILELLRYHPRVLYIDIDIHHGDGVELAFYQSNRVMTVSFHKYTGDFFPGTGKLDDIGQGHGKYYSVNVPLQDGIDDDMYLTVFKAVIEDCVASFRPSAIVLQCGADSLGCDRLGAFNLSIAAHGECVNFVRKFNVPLLVLGGGGYTIRNVSRCWTYETAVLIGADIPDELPATAYDAYFEDTQWKLHPPLTGKVENQNTPSSLQKIISTIREKLRYLQGAPSIQMQDIPSDLQGLMADEERTQEERQEERGTGTAGDERFSRPASRVGSYTMPYTLTPPASARGTPRTRTSGRRGGRRGGATRVSFARPTMDDDDDDSGTPPPKRRRGRPPKRGGRGRRGGAVAVRPKGPTPEAASTPARQESDLELEIPLLESSTSDSE